MYVCVCIYIYMYMCVYIYIYISLSICMYVCMYVCIYIYIYIYIYIHIHKYLHMLHRWSRPPGRAAPSGRARAALWAALDNNSSNNTDYHNLNYDIDNT